MTTDPFTDAARAEAERQNPVPTAYQPNGPSQWERLLAQEAFQNGAEWAHTHLAVEVRKAKAEALREAADEDFYDEDMDMPVRGYAELYWRADRIEAGDQR